MEQPPIGDYAVVGDCESIALVSRSGSIDWLCWPRFESPSVFGRLLDWQKGGYLQIAPAGPFESERRYVPETNVLETVFETETGVVRLRDWMAVDEGQAYEEHFWPDHLLLRQLECMQGHVEVEWVFCPRPNYARDRPRIEDRGRLGLVLDGGTDVLVLRTSMECMLAEDRRDARGGATMEAGEKHALALAYDVHEPAVLPLLGEAVDEQYEASCAYWKGWSAQCSYEGPYREAVLRSALTVKLLTHGETGAVIAAATTSLPEEVGGVRNWDYRFCWLRDASLTLQALFSLGFMEEEEAFLSWLLQASHNTLPKLQIVYDAFGNVLDDEEELDHLAGYRGSRPVRTGNDATGQFQLDLYGEVVRAIYDYIRRGRAIDPVAEKMLGSLGEVICERWNDPGNGIWEIRGERQHYTYSKAMVGLALERLAELSEEGVIDVPAEEYHETCERIRAEVEEEGYDEELGFTMTYGGRATDASLLLLAIADYVADEDERMKRTYRTIQDQLGAGDLLYRYRIDDGLPGEEGAFGICSFWAVQYLAELGEVEEARRRFEALLEYANDVGLYGEEIDPGSGDVLGNFPQAFTHVGLINAAVRLETYSGNEDQIHEGAHP